VDVTITSRGVTAMTETLGLFTGRCGHRWIGAEDGFYGCPLCGDSDDDHHLESMEEIPVRSTIGARHGEGSTGNRVSYGPRGRQATVTDDQ
jgi:hypothetical protein